MRFSLSGEEIQIDANENLLKQVWINLIDNAVKFSPNGAEIAINIVEEKDKISITIADHGNGIALEAQKHIFDKFYQEDTSHATKGNGLGLALCKKIVDLHHGEISLLHSDSRGSVFEVILPAPNAKLLR